MHYILVQKFDLPAPHCVFDAIPDSGCLLAYNGVDLLKETFALSRTFDKVAAVSLGAPSVIRVAPNGELAFAIQSNGKKFFVFEVATGKLKKEFEADECFYFDGEWTNDGLIAITEAGTAEGRLVRIFDLDNNNERVVVNNIGAASGGVSFCAEDKLYAGNGFSDNADDETGEVRAFQSDDWRNATSPIDFEAGQVGTEVANLLSGAYLGFDRYNNLFIGGGDVFSSTKDFDYSALIFRSSLDDIFNSHANAINPQSPQKPAEPNGVWQRIDPDPDTNQAWMTNANRITGEFLITPFESNRCYSFLMATDKTKGNERTVEFQTNLHLGDNPIAFPKVPFCGAVLEIGFPLPNPSGFSGDFTLLVKTREMQTWGDYQGHKVSLGGELLPIRLKDPMDASGSNEEFEIVIDRSTYGQIYDAGAFSTLRVEVELISGGLSDDFVLICYGYRICI